jgi:hypothetical protein
MEDFSTDQSTALKKLSSAFRYNLNKKDTSERDFIDIMVRDDSLSNIISIPDYQVDHTRWEPRLFDKFTGLQSRQRGEL